MTILIEDIEMPVRAHNVVKALGVTDLDGLRELTEEDVLAVKGAGAKICRQIKETVEAFAAPEPAAVEPAKPKKRDRSKVKHQCPNCRANVWGKENIHVVCGDCDRQMEEA